MYTDVRLGYSKDTSDAKRAEFMERLSDDGGSDRLSGLGQGGLYVGKIIKKVAVAAVKL